MDAAIHRMRSGRAELLIVFLFFCNSFLLPDGLTYSLLLTPVWIYLLYKKGILHLMRYPLALMGFYAVMHIAGGVTLHYYLISSLLLLGVATFVLLAARCLQSDNMDLDYLFRRIVLLNFALTLLSLLLFFIPVLKPSVWYIMAITDNVEAIPRLKLFTLEASHYSYLLAPVALWFYTQAFVGHTKGALPTLLLVTIPLLLSLSFGVLGCVGFSGLIMGGIYFKQLFPEKSSRRKLWMALLAGAAFLVLLYIVYPDNLLFLRLRNMTHGNDTSFRGRTYESFILAHKIVGQKSYWWGIGPGQLKVFARDIIVQYYYYSKIPDVIRIPNAAAETIVCFGYAGLALRLGLELLLFFRTKVYRSPYRLWLFLFLFLFQAMGSYITNPAEYIFWALAFSPAIDAQNIPLLNSRYDAADTR